MIEPSWQLDNYVGQDSTTHNVFLNWLKRHWKIISQFQFLADQGKVEASRYMPIEFAHRLFVEVKDKTS
jgi:hypothetical protein